ncbi:hypothetical protein GCM10025875_10280 [Litorihabitans aurantiacus]|uniref:Uncharacterized protein n=1 Tax=Litorihabitans aurantiacus TaxID=1930061 RepID=A0AA37XD42_9MICO|nr:hypothetical protein GCM10025875_10280 [Litorihabitans aurantiacus]
MGSVNYDDAETTIRTAAEVLGGRLRRIPDGEVGRRFHWIMFQTDVLSEAEGIERVGDEPIPLGAWHDFRPLRIVEGVAADELRLPPLGYAEAAVESYAIFARLRREGAVAAGTRFQVSLPTPVAIVSAFFHGEDRAAFEPVYTAAMLRELDVLTASIPQQDLALQWDVCSELGIVERAGYGTALQHWWEGDPFDGLVARVAALLDAVPAAVEVGAHFCYGDVAETHFVEPEDTGVIVRFANAVLASSARGLTFAHLPVPIDRDDAAYFAPLVGLSPVGELYLGLVHRQDGLEGAQRRIAAAQQHVQDFGVATECGIGRAPAGTTEGILATHAAVATAW